MTTFRSLFWFPLIWGKNVRSLLLAPVLYWHRPSMTHSLDRLLWLYNLH